MNLLQVAKLIPRDFRDQILEGNIIYKTVAIPSDPHMFILFTVWTTFVNSGGGLSVECTKCLGEILRYFQALEPLMIDLYKADQALKISDQ